MTNLKEDNQAFVNQLAETVCRLGLQVPVLVGLEAGRPFAFFGGQFLWITKPVLSLFISGESIGSLAEMLEEPDALDSLVTSLEARMS